MPPRCAKTLARCPLEVPRCIQDIPKYFQDASRKVQDAPKMPSRCCQDVPKSPEIPQTWVQIRTLNLDLSWGPCWNPFWEDFGILLGSFFVFELLFTRSYSRLEEGTKSVKSAPAP